MMDMQILGMMNYISSIMEWQNAGRTSETAARNTVAENSFGTALRQAQTNYMKKMNINTELQKEVRGELPTYNNNRLSSTRQTMNPYQSLALMGILTGSYGWSNIF